MCSQVALGPDTCAAWRFLVFDSVAVVRMSWNAHLLVLPDYVKLYDIHSYIDTYVYTYICVYIYTFIPTKKHIQTHARNSQASFSTPFASCYDILHDTYT